MRERIFQYLEQAKRSVSAVRILQDALNIASPNGLSAQRVVDGILAKDPRFQRQVSGRWQISSAFSHERPEDLSGSATLVIQSSRAPARNLHIRGAVHVPETGATWEFARSGPMSEVHINEFHRWTSQIRGRLLLVWNAGDLRLWNALLQASDLATWESEVLSLQDLAGITLARTRLRFSPDDLASSFGVSPADNDNPAAMARFLAGIFEQLLLTVPREYRQNRATLHDWIESRKPKVDFTRFAFGREFLQGIPDSPGVYILRNRAQDVLYVGKARSLKRRIRSYFTPRAATNPKVARIHEQLHSLEFFTTRSEVEALLLEMHLIQKFHPPINTHQEVHERSAVYGKRHNLILLVPEKDSEQAEAYFLCSGSFVGQQTVALGCNPAKSITRKIQSIYFKQPARRKNEREEWELELVSRWLASNRRRLNYIDVDQAGSFESVLRQFSDYLKDPDLLSRKVYYR